tara:strand:- start:45 stop:818 length:774 start_codon:yes stop_codon:yes gene_type:complete
MKFKLNKNIILIIIILIIVGYRIFEYKKDERIQKQIIKYGEEYFNDKLTEGMLPVSALDKLRTPKKLEITALKTFNPQIFLRYGNNNNHLYNDGRSVWQNMVRHLENRAIICGKRYGLSRLEWHKSVLTWNNQEVGLELHIVHSCVENKDTIIFVIPLSLVDLRTEGFTELSYNTQSTDVATVNALITKCDQVPAYFCCSPNVGPMVNFNLCPVANVILKQKKFYQYQMSNTTKWLITEPEAFDRNIGLNIRSKLVG